MCARDSRGLPTVEIEARIAALVARKYAAGERLPRPVRIRYVERKAAA